MRLLFSTGLALTAALVAAGPGIDLAAAPNKRPGAFQVTVTFNNRGGDRIQSDGLNGGSYQDRVGGVVAYIAASDSGALIFSTGSTGRKLTFFFDDCAGPLCGLPPGGPTLVDRAGFLSHSLNFGGMTNMDVGAVLEAWVKFDIPLDSDPNFWNVCFDADGHTAPCSVGDQSVNARIRRDTKATWTIFADPPPSGLGLAADIIKDNGAKRNRYAAVGTYSMPFELTVACVNLDADLNCM